MEMDDGIQRQYMRGDKQVVYAKDQADMHVAEAFQKLKFHEYKDILDKSFEEETGLRDLWIIMRTRADDYASIGYWHNHMVREYVWQTLYDEAFDNYPGDDDE